MDPVPSELSPEAAALMAKEVTESLASSSEPTETSKTESKTEKKGFIARKLEERKVERENRDKPKTGDVVFDKSEFNPGAGTGLKAEGRRRGRPYKETSSTEVIINTELITQHTNFLKQHLLDLKRITNSRVLDAPSHRIERQLIDMLSDGGKGISDKKVEDFVKTSQGLIITEMLMDLRTELESFAFGIDFHAAWGRRIQNSPTEGGRIINVGDLRREFRGVTAWLREHGGRYPDRRSALAGAIAGGTLGGATSSLATWLIQNRGEDFLKTLESLTEVQVAGIVGLIGGAVSGGILGRRFLTNNGDIDFRACSENLQTIKNLPPEEKEYIKSVTGVDFDDYDVLDGHVVFAREPHELRTKDIFSIQDNIRQRLQTRQDFYKSIGLVRPDTRTVPFSPIRPNYEYFPRTDTIWIRRVNELYWDGLAAAEVSPVDALGVRTTEGLKIHIEAQQQALNEYLEKYIYSHGLEIDKRTGKVLKSDDSVALLESELTNITTKENKLKEKLETRRKALEGEGTKVDEKGVETHDGQLGRLDKLLETFTGRTKLQRELRDILQATINEHGKLFDIRNISTIEQLFEGINTALTNLETERLDIIQAADLRVAGISPDEVNPDKSRDIIYADRDKQIVLLQTRIDNLSTAREKVGKEEKKVTAKRDEIYDYESKQIKQAVLNLRSSYDYFVRNGRLTQEQLLTLSVAELQSILKIPESERNQKSNLDVLIYAKAEAQARHILLDVRHSSELLQIALNVSVEELQAMSVDQINQAINIIYESSGKTQGWPRDENENTAAMIERAKEIGTAENTVREEAIRITIENISDEALFLKESQENTENGILKRQIELVKSASSSDAVYPKVISIFRDVDQRQRFFDTTAVPAESTDYPTSEEKKLNSGLAIQKPRAYYEFLDLIFDYKSKTERGPEFAAASRLIRPVELAAVLNENLGLGIPRGRIFFTNVISEIQTRFNNGMITERDMRTAMTDVLLFVRGRIKSLA